MASPEIQYVSDENGGVAAVIVPVLYGARLNRNARPDWPSVCVSLLRRWSIPVDGAVLEAGHELI